MISVLLNAGSHKHAIYLTDELLSLVLRLYKSKVDLLAFIAVKTNNINRNELVVKRTPIETAGGLW